MAAMRMEQKPETSTQPRGSALPALSSELAQAPSSRASPRVAFCSFSSPPEWVRSMQSKEYSTVPLGHWGEGEKQDHSSSLCSVVTGAQRNGVAMLGVCACAYVCVCEN